MCEFDSILGVNNCVHSALPILELIAGLVGVGTFALITLLHWVLKRLRRDLGFWESEYKKALAAKASAEDYARTSASSSQFAQREVDRLRDEIKKLNDAAGKNTDQLASENAELRDLYSELKERLDATLSLTGRASERFWSRPPEVLPQNYNTAISKSIPIILLGNQKGGVSKTTLTTNLAACFARRGERVLVIDLDYQGSASSLLQLQARVTTKKQSTIDYLFTDFLDPEWRSLAINSVDGPFPRHGCLDFISAYYSFESTEREIEYRWTLKETTDDVRYRLARALLSPDIQQDYDRILLDAPPRLTGGFLNGFCAATHLFVPTIVDRLSAQSVDFFADRFRLLRPELNPGLVFGGVIGVVRNANPQNQASLPSTLKSVADRVDEAVQARLGSRSPFFFRDAVVMYSSKIARASESGIAYLLETSICNIFDKLADRIQAIAPGRQQ
jgi:cellulose biosynthesis protein BcsQ